MISYSSTFFINGNSCRNVDVELLMTLDMGLSELDAQFHTLELPVGIR